MVLKQHISDAFRTLGLTPDVDFDEAKLVYKKLALKHHPDRCYGDAEATERFQEVGAAWEILQEHYEDPAASEEMEFSGNHGHFTARSFAQYMFKMDMEEFLFFCVYQFDEEMANRHDRRQRARFRRQRQGASGSGVYGFSPFWVSEQQGRQENQRYTRQAQAKVNEEYAARVRRWEKQLAAEEAELLRTRKEEIAMSRERQQARGRAMTAGHAGDFITMRSVIEQYDIDVNAGKDGFDRILHVAARKGDADILNFLVESRRADLTCLNGEKLTPFHVAAKYGNLEAVKYFIDIQRCHPSKAAENGQTPLQLAMGSVSHAKDVDTLAHLVALLVKPAPVHDVTRCWSIIENEMEKADEDMRQTLTKIKDALLTKNGFVPYDFPSRPSSSQADSDSASPGFGEGQSKKARLRRNRREREEKELKEAKLRKEAEKQARVDADLRKSEENKRREQERRDREMAERLRIEEEARQKAEQEQMQRDAAIRAEQEAAWRAEAESERLRELQRQQAEAAERERLERERITLEERARQRAEAKSRKEAEERVRYEQQAIKEKAKREAEAKRQAEEKARHDRAETEEEAKQKAELRARREAEARARADVAHRARMEKEAVDQLAREQEKARRQARSAETERRQMFEKRERERAEAQRHAEAAREAELRKTKIQAFVPISPPLTPVAVRMAWDMTEEPFQTQTADMDSALFDPPMKRGAMSLEPEAFKRPSYTSLYEDFQTAEQDSYLFGGPADPFEPSAVVVKMASRRHASAEAHGNRGRGRGRGRGQWRARSRGRGRGRGAAGQT
ncbi:hypothetical protein PUNSTDRAFT_139866 [Punctularia strigosozonata HHB-11173 SS5]|uniref:uncharacterized protein n=1 Tax=Punctularia strigosozonata (strain HHB-11173) TaxID=741275 RepID=UPI00044180BF|nr:uncharacterized protein PUNSTDRAFT_139866 [Punctularia strigosozonata HHB-11173 SS5]EIN13247.1 hypothetical protein PUNSTDRAFT_139866 [Punctularia strigosozonata HHB-11173 SS5]